MHRKCWCCAFENSTLYEEDVGGDGGGVISVDDDGDEEEEEEDDEIAVRTFHATVFRCATCRIIHIYIYKKKITLKPKVVPDGAFQSKLAPTRSLFSFSSNQIQVESNPSPDFNSLYSHELGAFEYQVYWLTNRLNLPFSSPRCP